MKKIRKKLFVILSFLLVVGVLCGDSVTVFAAAPYYTWTQGPNGKMVYTQTAYTPGTTIQAGFSNPEDMHVYDGKIYVADSGNKRIVVLKDNEIVQEIIPSL